MKAKWKTYKTLDGSCKRLVQRVGDGSIMRRFDKTRCPEKETDVVCPHFLELAWSFDRRDRARSSMKWSRSKRSLTRQTTDGN